MQRYPDFPPSIGLVLSSTRPGVSYELVKAFKPGGMGIAFKALQHGGERNGDFVVLKFPRLDIKSFPLEKIRERIDVVHRALQSECEAMSELVETEGIAPILELGGQGWQVEKDGRKEFLHIFHAVYDFVDGLDLDQWCAETFPDPSGTFCGLPNAESWFLLARQMFELLDKVHHQRVVHGDIWPPNIKVGADRLPVLIDFGQAWSLDRDFEKESGSDKHHPYLAPERHVSEEHANRWYATADIYSMGGILYFLATGQSPLSPWVDRVGGRRKANRVLKQEITSQIKAINPVLHQANAGIVDIILTCLTPHLDYRARHARAVLDTIDAFDVRRPARHREEVEAIARTVAQIWRELKVLRRKPYSTNPVFRNIVRRRVRALRDELAPLRSRVFSITGDREAHVNGLLDCVSLLGPGDELVAVTTARFWRKDNFGPYGRLASMLSMAALRGARIRWIVLARESLEDDREALEYQRRCALDYLEASRTNAREYGPGINHYVSYRLVPAEEIEMVRRKRDTFILLRVDEHWTLVAPDYSAASGSVSITRFWADPKRRDELLGEYDTHHERSLPITRFAAADVGRPVPGIAR